MKTFHLWFGIFSGIIISFGLLYSATSLFSGNNLDLSNNILIVGFGFRITNQISFMMLPKK